MSRPARTTVPDVDEQQRREVTAEIEAVWQRIQRHAGESFQTTTGLRFTYRVLGNYLRVARNGREINRSLSRTNFARALELMPATQPTQLKARQGPSYTWGILMDHRIRRGRW